MAHAWRRELRGIVVGGLAIGLSLGVFQAIQTAQYPGFLKGDEVEVLHEAVAAVSSMHYERWEIRNSFLTSYLLRPYFVIVARIGVPKSLLMCALPFIVASSLNCLLLGILSYVVTGSRRAALTSTVLYGLHWIPLTYGSLPFPRPISTVFVLLGALMIAGPPSLRRALGAGTAVGVAFSIRYSEVVFLPSILFVQFVRQPRDDGWPRAGRMFAVAGGFVAGSALTGGMADLLQTGRFFDSLWNFASYTLVLRESSSLEASQPWYWYAWRTPHWIFPLLPILFVMLWKRIGSEPRSFLIGFAVIPVLCLSLIHHKEMRYLQACMPFAMLAAASALESWEIRGRWKRCVIVLAVLWHLSGLTILRKKSMNAFEAGQYLRQNAVTTACMEQSWAYGAHWALGSSSTIIDVERTGAWTSAPAVGCQAVAVYGETAIEKADWLRGEGFALDRVFDEHPKAKTVMVFRKSRIRE